MRKYKDITWGKHSYGDIRVTGYSWGKILIGKYTSIGLRTRGFFYYDHKITNISSYPFGHRNMPISKLIKPPVPTRRQFCKKRKTTLVIGNDVWIGSNVTLFGNVAVGDGAVIGAFSTITKDVPPYSVVVGQSRILRKRFPDEDIDFLLKLKWWDFPDEEVASIAQILCSPDMAKLKEWAKENKKI